MQNKKIILLSIMYLLILTSCARNNAPVIKSVDLSEDYVGFYKSVVVSVSAADPDGNPLTIKFAGPGVILYSDKPNEAFWTPPGKTGTYEIQAIVSDGLETVFAATKITVSPNKKPVKLARTLNTSIVNAKGQVLTLRGVGMSNDVYAAVPEIPKDINDVYWANSPEDYKTLKQWGGNLVRFYLHSSWFEKKNIAETWKYIDNNLAWAKANGIYVILDMHLAPGETSYSKALLWKKKENLTNYRNLWLKISDKYKNDETVLGYDLLNEPQPPTDQDWWNLAQETINLLRSHGDNHILIIENSFDGNVYGPFPSKPLSGGNIAYSFHFYDPIEFTHQGTSWTGLPENIQYPYTKQKYEQNLGVYTKFSSQQYSTTGQWVKLEPDQDQWATPPEGATMGYIEFGSHNNAGTIWIDDVELEKKSPDGKIRNVSILNSTFNQVDPNQNPIGWYSGMSNGNLASFTWENKKGHNDNYSLKISTTSGSSHYAIWSQNNSTPPYYPSSGFKLEPGCSYRVSGWVNGEKVTGWNAFQLHWAKVGEQTFDKNKLRAEINSYVKWATDNNVPLYCGEFGVVGAAPGDSEERWAADSRSILEGDNAAGMYIPWTYHIYRDYLGTSDPESRCDMGLYSEAHGNKISDQNSLHRALRDVLFR